MRWAFGPPEYPPACGGEGLLNLNRLKLRPMRMIRPNPESKQGVENDENGPENGSRFAAEEGRLGFTGFGHKAEAA